jgi:hypothetical protein
MVPFERLWTAKCDIAVAYFKVIFLYCPSGFQKNYEMSVRRAALRVDNQNQNTPRTKQDCRPLRRKLGFCQ